MRHRLVPFLAFVLAVNFAIADGPTRIINTSNDFMMHTRAHIERVEVLGVEILRLYPRHFQGIDEDLLRGYLSLHDKAKETFSNYGSNREKMNGYPKIEADAIVSQLNEQDIAIRHQFFLKNGLILESGGLSEKAILLMKIERVADLVDRGMNPVSLEEFGKTMRPASEILTGPLKRIAKHIETLYPKLTEHMTFENYVKRSVFFHCVSETIVQFH